MEVLSMRLSRLAAKCRACANVDTCEHKKMEEVGFLEPSVSESVSQGAAVSLAQLIARETVEIYVNNKPMVVYKDTIQEQLMEEHYRYLGVPGYR